MTRCCFTMICAGALCLAALGVHAQSKSAADSMRAADEMIAKHRATAAATAVEQRDARLDEMEKAAQQTLGLADVMEVAIDHTRDEALPAACEKGMFSNIQKGRRVREATLEYVKLARNGASFVTGAGNERFEGRVYETVLDVRGAPLPKAVWLICDGYKNGQHWERYLQEVPVSPSDDPIYSNHPALGQK